ncbi:hypothetical protein VITFI_CDS0779 [Vitreoscilla filiformis]|jgi:hypothetical protein|uniref:DUF4276 family protein n=1 Tax=Vitreoscilla filiformis TaxID=63 RepID=A0A221KC08_VITFI|nr:hypothetical protein [Vitreoscilla filiformis]ASM76558.1 hypothetical protein VITFI_CDS0779 [Vitreoscilla filiformis]
MVRLGFIVEGDSEKIMVESANFKRWANAQGLEICRPVINARGGGNLLPQHMASMVATLTKSQPDHVVVLTDLETAPDIETVKVRITDTHTSLIFVAVKALEAWFLADTEAMRAWLKQPAFVEASPEQTPRHAVGLAQRGGATTGRTRPRPQQGDFCQAVLRGVELPDRQCGHSPGLPKCKDVSRCVAEPVPQRDTGRKLNWGVQKHIR